ncbi:MAG TPA: DUF3795 domain-containing protein [Clostridia bacterium]|nr:DUF3795 domain-containing protein [Clostridia bacterium]
MSEKTDLRKVSEETMRFMRGKYVLDEVGDGNNILEFREGGETILTIRIHEDCYDFHIDEKCIPVADLETLESVKQMIIIKKKPNRKPFSKEQAIYASCGHRCDLCVHYNGGTISEEFRAELKERLIRVYAGGVGDGGYWGDDMEFCDGCHTGGLDKSYSCDSLKCAAKNGVDKCQNCRKNPCDKAHHLYQGLKPEIHTNTIAADDVTWVILPYVYDQYGN